MMYEQYIILQFKAEKNEIEARAKAQERATALMSMWKDYNHYYTDFSNYILPQITTRVAQIVTGEKQDDIPQVINLEKPKTKRLKLQVQQ